MRLAPQRAVLVVVSIAAVLLGLEVGLRVQHAWIRGRSFYQHAAYPGRVFERKPHARAEINSLGLRDRELLAARPPGALRVVALGDSVTAGYCVAFDEAWPKRLETLLRKQRAQDEVLNFGVPQYSTVQEVALLEELGIGLGPDLVVLAYVLNDPTPDGSINDFFRSDRAPSLAIDWIGRRIRRLPGGGPPPWLEGCTPFDYYSRMHCDAGKWARVEAAVARLHALSATHGFDVLLAVFPLLPVGTDAGFEDYPWAGIHERVLELGARNGFATLDLRHSLTARRPAELRCAPDDRLHPNATGHDLAARALLDAILELRPAERVASG